MPKQRESCGVIARHADLLEHADYSLRDPVFNLSFQVAWHLARNGDRPKLIIGQSTHGLKLG
jgi:hypothetical protein